jgi:hypothetical protein
MPRLVLILCLLESAFIFKTQVYLKPSYYVPMLLQDIIFFVESLDKHRRLLFGKGGLIKENRIWSDGPWCAHIRKKNVSE